MEECKNLLIFLYTHFTFGKVNHRPIKITTREEEEEEELFCIPSSRSFNRLHRVYPFKRSIDASAFE